VIEDPKLRATLKPFTWGQSQVVDASHYVVFARKLAVTEEDAEKFINLVASTRHVPVASLKGYNDLIVGDLVNGPRSAWVREWSARQTYIALGSLLTSAALLGIDTCPIEGLDPAKYDEVLGLPEKGFSAVCTCALGYRSPNDNYAHYAKVRFPINELIEKR
jgi:nitroreductase